MFSLLKEIKSNQSKDDRSNLKQAQLYGFAYGFSQCVVFAMYGGAFRFGAWQVSVGDMAPENVYK